MNLKKEVVIKVEWVKKNKIPDSLYLSDISSDPVTLPSALKFFETCKIAVRDNELENRDIGFICTLVINADAIYEEKSLDEATLRKEILTYLDLQSANIVFYLKTEQEKSTAEALERLKYMLNDLLGIDQNRYRVFYSEFNSVYGYQRELMIEIVD